MGNYIDVNKLKVELDRQKIGYNIDGKHNAEYDTCVKILRIIDSLQQEQPEMDLEKLGEIARHIIAVKDHAEDMRLSEEEWLLLNRIGYPERFDAGKGGK